MAEIVYLVGAGPGDPELLSLKAVHCLEKAQVVVYDRLADEHILKHAPEDAEFIYVGKASSNHTMKQEDINQLLVDKALEGKVVVRLKGGDPFVFGRGGEEALLLEKNGVPFEIVPGITSAISVPAYAGIPVTHRGVATSFSVITGHEDPTKPESQMKWDKLATGTDTLVFLMGIQNLPKITAKLIENGRPGSTPAAVIRWGTKPEQQVLTTTVENAAEDVKRAGLKPPAIFIVGETVALRDKLKWFDDKNHRVLFGKNILVTRARAQASALSEKLKALGANSIEVPAIRLTDPEDNWSTADAAIRSIGVHQRAYQLVVFTSPNGVNRFLDRMMTLGKDIRCLGTMLTAAIGSSTAAAMKKRGLIADVIGKEFRAEGLVEALRGRVCNGWRVLIPRAQEARNLLPEELEEMGASVDVVPVYRTVMDEDSREKLQSIADSEKIDLVTFTSSSTVSNFVKLLGGKEEAEKFFSKGAVRTACIGPITADTCREMGLPVDMISKEYTIDGLVSKIVENLADKEN